MTYKDPDKQREANKEASQRMRDKKGMTDDCAKAGIVIPNVIPKIIPERTAQGNIRVSKPGDDDYVPQCETTRAFIEGRDKRPETGKRGKDIKVFADLPPDVQEVIHKLSTIAGKIDQRVKANRTAIAINYQHLFPESYEQGQMEITRAEAAAAQALRDADYYGACTPE